MKNGLKKLLGVYQKGIECIQDYEGIGYLETCQVLGFVAEVGINLEDILLRLLQCSVKAVYICC